MFITYIKTIINFQQVLTHKLLSCLLRMFPITSSTHTLQSMLAPKHLKKTKKALQPQHPGGVSCLPGRSLPLYRIKIRVDLKTSNVTPWATMHANQKLELQNVNTARILQMTKMANRVIFEGQHVSWKKKKRLRRGIKKTNSVSRNYLREVFYSLYASFSMEHELFLSVTLTYLEIHHKIWQHERT